MTDTYQNTRPLQGVTPRELTLLRVTLHDFLIRHVSNPNLVSLRGEVRDLYDRAWAGKKLADTKAEKHVLPAPKPGYYYEG